MKKNSIWYALPALVLCMGAFFMPVTAHAKGNRDTTPPTVSAELSGDTLHIEASDGDSGVDAVYIGTKRINYRVDNAIDVELEDYAGTEAEKLGVYAVDFAGNQSEVVEIKNPYYEGAADTGSIAGQNPFTPAGQASVLDNATNGDGKEFYTFVTPEENVFYLVIDNQRDSENVYFLNAVTEDDLMALAEKGEKSGMESEGAVPEVLVCTCADKCEAGMVNTSCPVCKNDLSACAGKEQTPPETEEPVKEETKKGSGGAFIFVLLAALAASGCGYYFKIYKPKHDLDDAEELDELLEDDEAEVNEDLETPDMPADAGAGAGKEMDTSVYDDYPEDGYPDGEPEWEGMEE